MNPQSLSASLGNSVTTSATIELGFGGRSSGRLGFGSLNNVGPFGQLFEGVAVGPSQKRGIIGNVRYRGPSVSQLSEHCDQCCLEFLLI